MNDLEWTSLADASGNLGFITCPNSYD